MMFSPPMLRRAGVSGHNAPDQHCVLHTRPRGQYSLRGCQAIVTAQRWGTSYPTQGPSTPLRPTLSPPEAPN